MSSNNVDTHEKLFRIASIPGDGIGTEVTEAAIQVLQKLAEVDGTFHFEFGHFDWSSENFKERGYYIPPDGIDQLKKFNAILFGAVGSPGTCSKPPLHRRFRQASHPSQDD